MPKRIKINNKKKLRKVGKAIETKSMKLFNEFNIEENEERK